MIHDMSMAEGSVAKIMRSNGPEVVINLIKTQKSDPNTLFFAFKLLSKLCISEENSEKIHDAGVLDALMEAIDENKNLKAPVLGELYTLMAKLASCEEANAMIGEKSCPTIVNSLKKEVGNVASAKMLRMGLVNILAVYSTLVIN